MAHPREEHKKKLEKTPADVNICSFWNAPIKKGRDNAVHVHQAPERIVGLDGQTLETKGKKKLKACYHAECYQKLNPELPGRIECKYCKILSMAKTLHDGTPVKDMCPCSCHDGKSYCSLTVA